jgi:glycosyltransferase involved in cell wall biosynthesis
MTIWRVMARVLLVTNFGRDLAKMRGAMLQSFRAAGHEVVVAAPPEDDGAPAALADLGVGFRPLPVDRTGLNPFRDLGYLAALISCYRQLRPQMVLAISAKPVVYAGLAARLVGRVEVCSIISGLGYVFSGSSLRQRALAVPLRVLYRQALRRNVAVFFQNEDDLSQFVRWRLLRHESQGAVMNGDGVDLGDFRATPPPGRKNFLLIGRLLRDKGVLEYVEAARIVRQQHPDARFRLVGWFDHNPNALREEEVGKWVETGTIEFLGFMPDVRPAIADCDVYVLPSYREGLPRTVCEAMAMGRPIITTDAPGCRQSIVHGRNGLLVPVGDAGELARAMDRLIRDPVRLAAMGRESRALAEQRFDARKVNAALVARIFGTRPESEPAR